MNRDYMKYVCGILMISIMIIEEYDASQFESEPKTLMDIPKD